MKFNLAALRIFAALAIMTATGFMASPLARICTAKNVAQLSANSAAQDALFAMLGGYRKILASLVWVDAYLYWEKEDIAKCMPRLDLAVGLDPSNVGFWNMGATIIAFDAPHWIFDARHASEKMQKIIRQKQGRAGIDFLERGIKLNPKSLRLRITKSLILEKVFDDKVGVLNCYEEMSKLGRVPIFVVRNHARSLEDLGRYKEALSLLQKNAKNYDKNHPSYEFYLRHIEELQNKLRE